MDEGGIIDKVRDILNNYFGKIIAKIPITPNQFTLLSLISALIGFFVVRLYDELFLYGIILYAVSFLVDGLDGTLARSKNMVTKFGAYFDGMLDRIVEFIVLVSLLPVPGMDQPVHLRAFLEIPYFYSVLLVMGFGSFLTAYAKAHAEHSLAITHEQTKDFKVILPRSYRVVLIFIGIFFPQIFPLIAILSLISVVQRMYLTYNYSK